MSQKALTEHAPMILDATCGFKNRKCPNWPAHATIRMDIRPQVKPDIVGDARWTDFHDNSIDEEYLDPPHLFRRGSLDTIKRLRKVKYHRMSPDMFTRYGSWGSREEWLDFADKSVREAYRILKPGGLLHYKLTCCSDNKMRVDDILQTRLFEVINHYTTESKGRPHKKRAVVNWLTMKSTKGF